MGNCSSLPPIVLFGIAPVGLKLTHILLRHDVEQFLSYFTAILVVIDALSSVAFNHIFPKQADSFVGDLTLTGTLLRRQQILDRVLGPASLKEINK